jgi:hypothetical protein
MIMSTDLAQQPATTAPAVHLVDPGVVLAEIDGDEIKGTRRHLLCSCRHSRDAHRHYRPGRDCALCECPRWSPWNLVTRLSGRSPR